MQQVIPQTVPGSSVFSRRKEEKKESKIGLFLQSSVTGPGVIVSLPIVSPPPVSHGTPGLHSMMPNKLLNDM